MSRRGNSYDNAQAASFIKAVKCEEACFNDYETFDDIVAHLPRFLNQVYNEQRLHSALGYLSPVDFEARHAQRVAYISELTCPASGVHSKSGNLRLSPTARFQVTPLGGAPVILEGGCAGAEVVGGRRTRWGCVSVRRIWLGYPRLEAVNASAIVRTSRDSAGTSDKPISSATPRWGRV